MKKVPEIVQKIESYYVSDDCIQIMIPYKNAITILNKDGILFHNKVDSNLQINKYLEDERRKQFPYSNIPTHYSTVGLSKKITYSNQLFEFEKPYIRIFDGYIVESFVVKDNNQALLINSVMQTYNKYTKHMTYDELLKFVEKNDNNEQTYYVYLNGSIPYSDSQLYPNEERIYNYIKNQFEKAIKNFREYQQCNLDTVSRFLSQNPWFLDYIEQNINNLDLSLVDFNIGIDGTLLIIRTNDDNITIQGIDASFIKHDDFKVDIYDILVTKYTLEQLKFKSKINTTKEPRIPLRLNPSVTKQDIQEAKQMVKTFKNKNVIKF